MSKFDRRHMLKVMAATAAGTAASATGIEKAFAASTPLAASPSNPFQSSSSTTVPATSIRSALVAGNKSLNFMGQEFKPSDSSHTYSSGPISVGSMQAVAGTGGYYRASVNLPDGVIVTQVLFDLIVNDVNPAIVYFNGFNPETGAFAVNGKTVSTQAPTIQTVDMAIPPTTVDAVNNAYALYWFPGTVGATHQLVGARVAWMLNPGLTLFPNPRRVVDGFATPFTSGTTYGPFDATHQVYPVAAPSGIPAGAKSAFCAVQSYSSGVLTVFPDLTTDPLIANFTATADGPLSLTYMMVPLSPAGKFKIHSYITGKVSVDVWGYVV